MNGQSLIISALVLFIHSSNAGHSDPSQASAICAQPNSDGTLISHEDCDKFYKCFKGIPVPINCPDNLLWNSDRDYCDWPQNVNCQRVFEDKDFNLEANDATNQVAETKDICNGETKLVSHEDCSKYIFCLEGVAIALECPQKMLFNLKTNLCQWQEEVNCRTDTLDVKIADEYVSKSLSDAAQICAASDSEGKHAEHDSCNKFYVCSSHVPVELSCPDNLHYNPAKKVCDWPENVACNK